MEKMNREEAIAFMSKSRSIEQWNNNRDQLIQNLGGQNRLPAWFATAIDNSGLVKVIHSKEEVPK